VAVQVGCGALGAVCGPAEGVRGEQAGGLAATVGELSAAPLQSLILLRMLLWLLLWLLWCGCNPTNCAKIGKQAKNSSCTGGKDHVSVEDGEKTAAVGQVQAAALITLTDCDT